MSFDDFDHGTASEEARLVHAIERLAEELPELLPNEPDVRAELGALLTRLRSDATAARDETLDEILVLLAARHRTRERLNELAGPEPGIDRHVRLAGDPFIAYERHVCPRCGRFWVVLDADEDDQPPERCPDDGAVLTDASGGMSTP
ncbi:hypothetical protein [Streptomyces sp. NPDC046862]|uniref:hypothetical protein n=1 Tax=Streptomyces sp. NPDC046862 TaxID=3154603 RepID=UPI003455F5F1